MDGRLELEDERFSLRVLLRYHHRVSGAQDTSLVRRIIPGMRDGANFNSPRLAVAFSWSWPSRFMIWSNWQNRA